MVHNRYRQRGGEGVSTDSEMALLRAQGHNVDPYFLDNRDLPELEELATMRRAVTGFELAGRAIWSKRTLTEAGTMLAAKRYDVVHVQNFFPQISPSIFEAAARAKVPAVMTLRNYRLVCAKGTYFRDGGVCESCLGKPVGWPAIRYSCYQGDRAATGAVVAMQAVHRALKTWENKVAVFVALTEFARAKAIEGGITPDRIVVKPNFLSPDPGAGEGGGAAYVFGGRLSEEKGLLTLIDAWDHVEERLRIIGDGPLEHVVRAAAARNRRIEYLGPLPLRDLLREMGQARAVIVPSLWYETFGRIVIESLAVGTPVIASDIGAVAELVDHGTTGLLFRPGDAEALAAAVAELAGDGRRLESMRKAARLEFEDHYTAEQNYPRLIAIYERAIAAGPA